MTTTTAARTVVVFLAVASTILVVLVQTTDGFAVPSSSLFNQRRRRACYHHHDAPMTTTTTSLPLKKTRSAWLELSMSSSSSSDETDSAVGAAAAAQIGITYCTGCRWGLRAFWMAQELLQTFQKEEALGAVTVRPSRPESGAESATFTVMYSTTQGEEVPVTTTLWDRKESGGGFIEMKDLKQLVRDKINPDRFLGHSDTADRREQHQAKAADESLSSSSAEAPAPVETLRVPALAVATRPSVTIVYCTGCNWMLRAGHVGMEIMQTFGDEINSVTFVPGRPSVAPAGTFVVMLNEETILWDRSREGKFPPMKQLKQKIRDCLVPDKDLGHIDDGKVETRAASDAIMDEEDAQDARNYFGVA